MTSTVVDSNKPRNERQAYQVAKDCISTPPEIIWTISRYDDVSQSRMQERWSAADGEAKAERRSAHVSTNSNGLLSLLQTTAKLILIYGDA
jgi:hypothetical protein